MPVLTRDDPLVKFCGSTAIDTQKQKYVNDDQLLYFGSTGSKSGLDHLESAQISKEMIALTRYNLPFMRPFRILTEKSTILCKM